MVDQIYPTELQLNKANCCDTEAPFLDLNLSISSDTVSTKLYDKRDDFDFDIVNFPFLGGDAPRSMECILFVLLEQLLKLVTSVVVTNPLLLSSCPYHKLHKVFSKF